MTSRAEITPIELHNLNEVGEFLHQHLNARISPALWIASLLHPWSGSRPNFGTQLRADGKLVGVMLAIYSEQTIDARTEAFCNPHSWCVLPEYRNQGIGLVLHLIRQPGYHFTMLTPNPKVAQIFRGLRFRDLDDGLCYFPNLPTHFAPLSAVRAESDPQRIAAMIPEQVRRDFEMHRKIPWLRFMAFGSGEDVCFIVYKTLSIRRVPCARIIHVSDPAAFERYRSAMQTRMLMKEGLVLSRVESRFLLRPPRFSLRRGRGQAKLVASKTLNDIQVHDLYSELVALDV